MQTVSSDISNRIKMLRRILKSKWFWVIFLLTAAGVYLYFPGTVSNLVDQIQLQLNRQFGKESTLDEALKNQTVKDWDYTTDLITANVIGTDLEKGTLTVSFVWPPGMINTLFGNERPVPEKTIKITCPKEESDLYAVRVPKDLQNPEPLETKLLQSGIDIVAEAQSEDTLFGYCADAECTEINRSCQLNRTILVEE